MWVVAAVIGYGIGSVPVAWIVARWRGTPDLREIGSGNVGATNVARVAGMTAGLIVAVLDMAKGTLSVVVAERISGAGVAVLVAGASAIVGHVYPVWLGLRGGKGVATTLGVFAVLAPAVATVCVLVLGVVVAFTRVVSLGSVCALIALPLATVLSAASPEMTRMSLVVAALGVVRHEANLRRLWRGTEPQLGARV